MKLNENAEILKTIATRVATRFRHAEEDRYEERGVQRPYTFTLSFERGDVPEGAVFRLSLDGRGPVGRALMLQEAGSKLQRIAEEVSNENTLFPVKLHKIGVGSTFLVFKLTFD